MAVDRGVPECLGFSLSSLAGREQKHVLAMGSAVVVAERSTTKASPRRRPALRGRAEAHEEERAAHGAVDEGAANAHGGHFRMCQGREHHRIVRAGSSTIPEVLAVSFRCPHAPGHGLLAALLLRCRIMNQESVHHSHAGGRSMRMCCTHDGSSCCTLQLLYKMCSLL